MMNWHRARSLRLLCLLLVAFLAGALGCHSLKLTPALAEKSDKSEKEQTPAKPGKNTFRVPPYVFYSDFELKRDHPLFTELVNLRDQVCKELQLPQANNIVEVYLFEDRKQYDRFMQARYPNLPNRRAFFVAQPRSGGGAEDLLVYTYWGDRIREDLRHELTHALLHGVLKDVPLWLDEGLAEYFELSPERKGVNSQHLDQIFRGTTGPFKPNLARLEQLGQVQQMTPAEYREAWGWVHWMLRGKPEARKVLLDYLQQLRSNPTPGALQPRLATVYPSPEEALEKHLKQLDNSPRHGSDKN